ncbi:MAG: hypothetical protein Q8O88_01230 [bacterium]|nr:hypothetical protein [bacterium]
MIWQQHEKTIVDALQKIGITTQSFDLTSSPNGPMKITIHGVIIFEQKKTLEQEWRDLYK